MNRNVIIVGTLVFLLAVFGAVGAMSGSSRTGVPQGNGNGSEDGVFCAADVRECPDGSFVSRKPPTCEFAACPATGTGTGGSGILPYNSGIRGTVMLGPTCPVVKDPPDAACADKPYATTVSVRRASLTTPFATTTSDDMGLFQFSLPPGEYVVTATGGNTLPRCPDVTVNVAANGYSAITVNCDTGIR